jgi:tRNA (cmo5U34)-methyltransferase
LSLETRDVWKTDWLVKRFLEGVRGGIPHASDQIDVMLRLIAASQRPIERFLDLGCGSGLLAIAVLAQYPNARATLVDYSEPMMDAARDLLSQDMTVPHFVTADLGEPAWLETVSGSFPVLRSTT